MGHLTNTIPVLGVRRFVETRKSCWCANVLMEFAVVFIWPISLPIPSNNYKLPKGLLILLLIMSGREGFSSRATGIVLEALRDRHDQ